MSDAATDVFAGAFEEDQIRLAVAAAMAKLADFQAAAEDVLAAADAYRDALNGAGHPGAPHDKMLWRVLPGEVQIYDAVGDCSACGGAQYGTEDSLARAYGALREALGRPRLPWEVA